MKLISQNVLKFRKRMIILCRDFHDASTTIKSYLPVKEIRMDSNIIINQSQSNIWTEMFSNNLPVLIKGLVNNWPAISGDDSRIWVKGERFREVGEEECTVPVEIGR